MMHFKQVLSVLFFFLISVCSLRAQDKVAEKAINLSLDTWHKAAAEANFNAYFNLMTTDAVFVGTDASEHWELEAFKAYSKPHFDAGRAWNFSALERHVYIASANLAWFDELLDTQMGICRGSGVIKYEDHTWKVAHYVLSAAIPNAKMNTVSVLKSTEDSTIITSFSK
ncbi:nuclear transport factor 2 family protein [uncultured Formosa sp.]|uniref:nuclear transport factor 2 family protein n=1 Tax=uncultured Formosa sp. TaxID=255435 RepID=UPI002610972C|nr:nuclear transport factor 2 family protein [uncultured Formosa sp.]